ncbi:MAG: SDR family oxidoreductase [Ignavibacteria bacterium]|nr:SDR family oxidoreductase [Ignavibacteria bacterium]
MIAKGNRPRIVVVTGASAGIGRALAECFARGGDSVVAIARSNAKLDTLIRKLMSAGRDGTAYVCDLRDEEAVERTFRSIQRRVGPIDILINNAGVTRFKSFSETSLRDFEEILETNLRALFLTTKAVLPVFLKRKRGHIINVLSFAAKKTYVNSSVYAGSKSGAAAMMDALREEVRSRGIQVMNVYPGAVLTRMWPRKIRHSHAARMIDPRIIAGAVFEATKLPSSATIEELVIRPERGDVNA